MAAALTTAGDYAEADKRALASARRKFLIGRVLSYAALGIAVLLVLFPIYWMIITSLKLPREIYRAALALAAGLHAQQLRRSCSTDGDFLVAIRNSFIVVGRR